MKNYFLALLFLITASALLAQEPEFSGEGGFDKSRLFFGGNFGLGFGSNTTSIIVSPQVGYRFSELFAAGAGVNFIYNSVKYSDFEKWTQGYTGFNIFGRIYPIQQIILQAQPEVNYSWGKIKRYDQTYKLEGKFVPSLLLGGGAAIPAGSGSFIIMAQYDVIQDARTPYGNKIFFNFGYNIGF